MLRINLTGALFISIILAAPALAQNLVDNPVYLSWARHKPGTTVVLKMNTLQDGQSMNMHITQVLKAVDPDQVTVEISNAMEMGGQKHALPPTTMSFKARVTEDEAKFGELPEGAKGQIKELGTETITVNGNTYECKVAEITSESEGVRTTGKVWRSDDVPGQMVKGEMKFQGPQSGTMRMELVSVDKK